MNKFSAHVNVQRILTSEVGAVRRTYINYDTKQNPKNHILINLRYRSIIVFR